MVLRSAATAPGPRYRVGVGPLLSRSLLRSSHPRRRRPASSTRRWTSPRADYVSARGPGAFFVVFFLDKGPAASWGEWMRPNRAVSSAPGRTSATARKEPARRFPWRGSPPLRRRLDRSSSGGRREKKVVRDDCACTTNGRWLSRSISNPHRRLQIGRIGEDQTVARALLAGEKTRAVREL